MLRSLTLAALLVLTLTAEGCRKNPDEAGPALNSGMGQGNTSDPAIPQPYELFLEVSADDHPLRELLPEKVEGSILLIADASATLQPYEDSLQLGKFTDGRIDIDKPSSRLDPNTPNAPVRDLTAPDVSVGALRRADLDAIDPAQIRVSDSIGAVNPKAIVNTDLITFRGMAFENKAALNSVLENGLDAPVVFSLKNSPESAGNDLINTVQGHQLSVYSDSIFISTSRSKELVRTKFLSAGTAESRQVLFAIDVPKGRAIDFPAANKAANNEQLLDNTEKEVAIVGNLQSSNIIGYWQLKNGKTGKFHINPQASKGARQRFLQEYPETRAELGWWDRVTN